MERAATVACAQRERDDLAATMFRREEEWVKLEKCKEGKREEGGNARRRS